MNGLELSEAYYHAYGEAMLRDYFPRHVDRIAVGLVGAGSECFGFDDTLSRDHDFGPSFCMWLTPEDYLEIGPEVRRRYDELPGTFLGFAPRRTTARGDGRVGALAMDVFYRGFIGKTDADMTPTDWLRIPETSLAAVTNGKVFFDPLGRFSAVREELLRFFPKDVALKKMAAKAAVMAQAGQYNLPRCLRRGETVAALIALGEFVKNAMFMIFFLNRRYPPFYKWTRRALPALPILGDAAPLFDRLVAPGAQTDSQPESSRECLELVETISAMVASELRRQDLSDSSSDFLADHAEALFARIGDPNLKRHHIMEG